MQQTIEHQKNRRHKKTPHKTERKNRVLHNNSNFNSLFLVINRTVTSKQWINKDLEDLDKTIKQFNVTDIYRTLDPR